MGCHPKRVLLAQALHGAHSLLLAAYVEDENDSHSHLGLTTGYGWRSPYMASAFAPHTARIRAVRDSQTRLLKNTRLPRGL